MYANIIKSYCAHMFKALKIFLLFSLVFQVAMMPVSQAFAARHIHDEFRVKTMASVSASSGAVVELQHVVKAIEPGNLSDMAHFSSRPHKIYRESRCGKKNGHKGECGSCQCTLIVDVPVAVQVTSVFIAMKFYNIQSGCPLYSVVIAPPLRPPTS